MPGVVHASTIPPEEAKHIAAEPAAEPVTPRTTPSQEVRGRGGATWADVCARVGEGERGPGGSAPPAWGGCPRRCGASACMRACAFPAASKRSPPPPQAAHWHPPLRTHLSHHVLSLPPPTTSGPVRVADRRLRLFRRRRGCHEAVACGGATRPALHARGCCGPYGTCPSCLAPCTGASLARAHLCTSERTHTHTHTHTRAHAHTHTHI